MKEAAPILADIKELIKTKGYIYALCMLLFEDNFINPEELHNMNHYDRISTKETALLLGFVLQNEIDFSTPDDPMILHKLKERTRELLDELHKSFLTPFFNKIKEEMQQKPKEEDFRKAQKDFFMDGDLLTEPIFYSGTGLYDFQYLDFLEKKYNYDKKWLNDNMAFKVDKVPILVKELKTILQTKAEKINFHDLRNSIPESSEIMKKKYPNEDWEKYSKEIQPMMEFHQYVNLFFDESIPLKGATKDDIREHGWLSFYKGIIELLTIRPSDFDDENNAKCFLDNFSITAGEKQNAKFQEIGDFNLINARPIIRLDQDRYLVLSGFLLHEAIYESPFYWMMQDKKYASIAGKNRGIVGEEIVYDFLANVFGKDNTFKSVKISAQKGQDITDIDILCILGSKALCVQVKSKKLTMLSRKGDDNQLQKDFKGAVQDAYEQGLVSRKSILLRGCSFYDENANEINLSEEIDEVYIMGITTENYPSLTHQTQIMLEKKDDNPFPMFSTIFDLELITYYLKDPYEFLYYIRQRTTLMDYFKANEEIVFLGYHLDTKLWKFPNEDIVVINQDFGQLIDRNYFPLKAGLKVSDSGDVIKARWQNIGFEKLCNQLKSLNQPKRTDIIFHLLDWSGDGRDDLVRYIKQTKQQTLKDKKYHNFSILPNIDESPKVGITYCSLHSDNIEELGKKLLNLCEVRKYKNKGDVWIGFGSLLNSPDMIDMVILNDQAWTYDKTLEEKSQLLLGGKGRGNHIRLGEKPRRNDQCHCGSGIKYKKCCGK